MQRSRKGWLGVFRRRRPEPEHDAQWYKEHQISWRQFIVLLWGIRNLRKVKVDKAQVDRLLDALEQAHSETGLKTAGYAADRRSSSTPTPALKRASRQ